MQEAQLRGGREGKKLEEEKGLAFLPFRLLGQICTTAGAAVAPQANSIVTATGRAWTAWRVHSLVPVLHSHPAHARIHCIAASNKLTAVSLTDGSVLLYRRNAAECRLLGVPPPGCELDVPCMLFIGQVLLVAFRSAPTLVIFSLPSANHELPESLHPCRTICLSSKDADTCCAADEGVHVTCMMHPAAYLNKVVVGLSNGSAELWNFDSRRRLYTFKFAFSWPTCAAPSPVLDVAAFGFADGSVLVHNLKYDVCISTFNHTRDSVRSAAVTALSFSSTTGQPLLAAGGDDGALSVWNLEDKVLHSAFAPAHRAAVVTADFLEGQPTLVTCGTDNVLKMYSFDMKGSEGRLLKSREGHFKPLTCIRFDGQGKRLLSGSLDQSLRIHHVRRDAHGRELSQGHISRKSSKLGIPDESLKLPPPTAIAHCSVRELDWDSAVTCHSGYASCYTWSLSRYALGEHVLQPPSPAQARQANSVSISSCGNYAHVAYESGELHAFNMQSGLHKGEFCRGSAKSRKSQQISSQSNRREPNLWALASWDQAAAHTSLWSAHDNKVIGVESDGSNRLLVSASADGYIRVWGMHERSLHREAQLGSAASLLRMHRGTSMSAVACEDHSMQVFDSESGRRVRRFPHAQDRVSDINITSDARWLLVAAMDSTLSIFDIPSAETLQRLHLHAPIVSMSVSPSNELFATAHAGDTGIVMWGNAVLCGACSQADLKREVRNVPLTSVGAITDDDDDGWTENVNGFDGDATEEYGASSDEGSVSDDNDSITRLLRPVDQVKAGAITTSYEPRSKFNALAYMEAIKERNQPQQPQREPEPAPFVLSPEPVQRSEINNANRSSSQSSPSPAPQVAARNEVDTRGLGNESTVRKELLKTLATAGHSGSDSDKSQALHMLAKRNPASIDAELMLLFFQSGPYHEEHGDEEGSKAQDEWLLQGALRLCRHATDSGSFFEAVQAFLAAVLRIHSNTLCSMHRLQTEACELCHSLEKQWNRLDENLHSARCYIRCACFSKGSEDSAVFKGKGIAYSVCHSSRSVQQSE